MPDTLLDRFSPPELRDLVGPLTVGRGAIVRSIEREGEGRSWAEGAEVRAAGEDSNEWIVSGHAAVFDVLSEELGAFYRFRERIDRGAFRRSLDESQDVVYLLDHEGLPLARTSSGTLELREDPRGLFSYARWARSAYSDPIATALERRDLAGMSFAFTVAEDEWVERNVEGQDEPEVIRTIKKVDRLFDVSVVGTPAYPQTDAQLRAQEIAAAAKRFGVDVPQERLQDGAGSGVQLFTGDGIAGGHEAPARSASPEGESGTSGDAEEGKARGVGLTDLQSEAKRRLSIAKAKSPR
jgi:HK97 family phage prohead protease